jgi:thioredoxin-like negative regulator of GroEL
MGKSGKYLSLMLLTLLILNVQGGRKLKEKEVEVLDFESYEDIVILARKYKLPSLFLFREEDCDKKESCRKLEEDFKGLRKYLDNDFEYGIIDAHKQETICEDLMVKNIPTVYIISQYSKWKPAEYHGKLDFESLSKAVQSIEPKPPVGLQDVIDLKTY